MATLSQRIRSLRVDSNLTQEEFGKIFRIVKSTVSLYESGKSVPNDQIKTEICRYFGVSMDYLVGLTDDPTPRPEAAALPAPDPVIQEALSYLEGLSPDALASALRCLQAIKTLDDVKGDGKNVRLFEKNA